MRINSSYFNFSCAYLSAMLFLGSPLAARADSTQVVVPNVKPQILTTTTTATTVQTTQPSGANYQPITCPPGYNAITNISYNQAQFYNPSSNCTAGYYQATGCNVGCNSGTCSPFPGLCCQNAPGYIWQNNDFCTIYSWTCTSWAGSWEQSSVQLSGKQAFIPTQVTCIKIENTWQNAR